MGERAAAERGALFEPLPFSWLNRYGYEIRVELFRHSLDRMRLHARSAQVIPLVMVASLWASAPHGWLLGWLALRVLCVAIAWRMVREFEPLAATPRPGEAPLQRWQWVESGFLFIAGTSWALLAGLLAPNSVGANIIILTMITGVFSYAASTSVASPPLAFALTIGVAMAMVLAHLPQAADDWNLPMSALFLLFAVMITLSLRVGHRMVVENIRLRLANEALARRYEEEAAHAARASRDKSAFLVAASHDMRQPVHALLMLVAALRERLAGSAHEALVEHVRQAGEAIGQLFSGLMALSKLETGQEVPVLATLQPEALLRNAVSRQRVIAASKGLALDLRISRRCAGLALRTDRGMLERVLDNLLTNALRYTPSGRVLATLRRTDRDGRARLLLQVHDTGIGIAQADLGRVFDPYFQVANPQRDRARGLGLGLAIVQRIVNLLHIELSLHSRLGVGTRVDLHMDAVPALPAPGERPAAHGDLRGLRVLMLDDDAMVLHASEMLLRSWGMDLRCALDLDAARAHLRGESGWQPDFAICDYRLGAGVNGIAALDELTRRCPRAVGVLQTGELAPAVHAEAEEAGYLVLTKPVSAELLRRTLATLAQARPEAE